MNKLSHPTVPSTCGYITTTTDAARYDPYQGILGSDTGDYGVTLRSGTVMVSVTERPDLGALAMALQLADLVEHEDYWDTLGQRQTVSWLRRCVAKELEHHA